MKKNWKPNTVSENIQSGQWDGICQKKIYHASNEKRETTHD